MFRFRFGAPYIPIETLLAISDWLPTSLVSNLLLCLSPSTQTCVLQHSTRLYIIHESVSLFQTNVDWHVEFTMQLVNGTIRTVETSWRCVGIKFHRSSLPFSTEFNSGLAQYIRVVTSSINIWFIQRRLKARAKIFSYEIFFCLDIRYLFGWVLKFPTLNILKFALFYKFVSN